VLSPIDARAGTFAEAIVALEDGSFAAVGRAGSDAVAWTSVDGRTWTRSTVGRLVIGASAGEPERMATIATTPSGLVAGGSAGPELGDRYARLWRSADGAAWTPISDSEAFVGGEVVAIVAHPGGDGVAPGGGLLALGRLGTGQRATGSVAWTSTDGEAWLRSEDPALAGGLVAAVVATPEGWLAVGSDADEREAVAWQSADGRAWTRAPGEPARLHVGEKIRMTDVVVTAEGYVAIGNFVGVQFGEGTSWRSNDGVTWVQAPIQAALGQGEPEAVVAWRDRLVIVGSRGAPDDYIPSAWISPNVP
jgi:hypothetical protein